MAPTITRTEFNDLTPLQLQQSIFIHIDTPLSDDERTTLDGSEFVVWVREDV